MPALFERKTQWTSHIGSPGRDAAWAPNYRSAVEATDEVDANFAKQERCWMVARMPMGKARRHFGARVRFTALGPVPQGSSRKVIQGGTQSIGVISAILVRDLESPPSHADLRRVLEERVLDRRPRAFALMFDASKAHRRAGVWPEEGGLQACLLGGGRGPPRDEDVILANTRRRQRARLVGAFRFLAHSLVVLCGWRGRPSLHPALRGRLPPPP